MSDLVNGVDSLLQTSLERKSKLIKINFPGLCYFLIIFFFKLFSLKLFL